MTVAPVLEVEGLGKVFRSHVGWLGRIRQVAAVDDVSFAVQPAETLALVGESGSGKSTTARLLLRLIEPTGGSIRFEGEDLLALSPRAMRERRTGIQMIFQDPFSSLNPRLSIGYQLAEPLLVHGLCDSAEARRRVEALLVRVGLRAVHAASFPHEFSGGQRQRIAIARALAAQPRLIVADEPVSALDVSVRAQILNLLAEIRAGSNLSMVFISHDLGVVWHVADRVAVMFRGRIVEIGPVGEVFRTPRHPYTLELLEAIPKTAPGARKSPPRARRAGQEPPAAGCGFAARCPLAVDRCRTARPDLAEVGTGRLAACFRASEVPAYPFPHDALDAAAQRRLNRLQGKFATGRGGAACAS